MLPDYSERFMPQHESVTSAAIAGGHGRHNLAEPLLVVTSGANRGWRVSWHAP